MKGAGARGSLNGKQMNETNGGNGAEALVPWPNHWVLPTAASFGWTVEAAAANPLRSTDEALARQKNKVLTEFF